MAGSQGLLVGILLLGTAALTSVAAAETVPLPTPAPLPKEGAAPPAARPSANEQSGLGGIAAGLKSLFHLDKQPEAPAAPAPTTAVALNPTQRTQIDKVSAYLSGVQQLGTPGLGAGEATPAEQGPPEGFYYWFGGIALVCALLQIRYYLRLDADRLEVIKLLTSSVMPLGILTVVVLAVILLGITTATESAGVGAAGAFLLAVQARTLDWKRTKEAVFLTAKTTAIYGSKPAGPSSTTGMRRTAFGGWRRSFPTSTRATTGK